MSQGIRMGPTMIATASANCAQMTWAMSRQNISSSRTSMRAMNTLPNRDAMRKEIPLIQTSAAPKLRIESVI